MGNPVSGHNGRIQIGSNIITNAHTWTLAKAVPTSEASQFEETHVRNVAGQRSDSGTITAWQPLDAKVLHDASGTEAALWLYPSNTVLTAYHYGVMLFTDYNLDVSLGSAVGATLNFVNANVNGTGMVAHGFAGSG